MGENGEETGETLLQKGVGTNGQRRPQVSGLMDLGTSTCRDLHGGVCVPGTEGSVGHRACRSKDQHWREWYVCFVRVLKGPGDSSSWRDQVVCWCARGPSAGNWRDLFVC